MDDLCVEVVIEVGVEVWIEAARRGSPDALGRALEACRSYLLGTAVGELSPDLRSKVDVSDLVQETFLEAFRDFAQFTGRTGTEWRAWLRRILLNNLSHLVRRYRDCAKRQIDREVSIDAVEGLGAGDHVLAADSSSPSRCAMKEERNAGLRQAIERLPEPSRQALALKLQELCTYEEMGRRLGCSAAAARKRWVVAIERLRHELDSST